VVQCVVVGSFKVSGLRRSMTRNTRGVRSPYGSDGGIGAELSTHTPVDDFALLLEAELSHTYFPSYDISSLLLRTQVTKLNNGDLHEILYQQLFNILESKRHFESGHRL
jgi:hypothetical protein